MEGDSVLSTNIEVPSLEDDLTIMVRRLARALRKADPGNELPDKAIDLLQRIGGLGSPMKAVVTMGDNSKQTLKKG